MGAFIWAVVLPVCLVALCLILRRPVRQFTEELHIDHARGMFHQQHEWLEARFLSVLAQSDPCERERWEDAHWHDEVLWARDRQTRRLLALIAVHFDSGTFEDDPDLHPRHSTALFEFRKGRWHADGKRVDEFRPDEVVLRSQRLEAIVLHHHPHRRV